MRDERLAFQEQLLIYEARLGYILFVFVDFSVLIELYFILLILGVDVEFIFNIIFSSGGGNSWAFTSQ